LKEQSKRAFGEILLFLIFDLDKFVDFFKLQIPLWIVKELSVIVSVVVRRIGFGMVRRSESGHFVSVDGIAEKKVFDFLGEISGVKCFHFAHKYLNIERGPHFKLLLSSPKTERSE